MQSLFYANLWIIFKKSKSKHEYSLLVLILLNSFCCCCALMIMYFLLNCKTFINLLWITTYDICNLILNVFCLKHFISNGNFSSLFISFWNECNALFGNFFLAECWFFKTHIHNVNYYHIWYIKTRKSINMHFYKKQIEYWPISEDFNANSWCINKRIMQQNWNHIHNT